MSISAAAQPPLAVGVRGQGSPLVVLHGGGPGCSAAGDFAGVLEAFAPHRTVYTVDLHQYGASPTVRIEGPQVAHHGETLIAALDALEIANADFVCQSLGSLAALEAVSRRPELARRLVLTGTQPVRGHEPDSVWTLGPRVRQEVFATGEATCESMRRLIEEAEWYDPQTLPTQLVARRVEVANRHHRVLPGNAPDGRGEREFLDEVLAEVAAPVLLLWGAHDRFCSPRYAEQLRGLLPHAELEVIDDAAHHVQSEQPAAYAEAALSFLLAA